LKIYTPAKTRTRGLGYGFAGVGVRVGLKNPRVTRAIPYKRHTDKKTKAYFSEVTWQGGEIKDDTSALGLF